MSRVITLLLATAFALSAAACGSEQSGTVVTDIAALTGDQANGKTLFGTKCAGCHGADGKSGSAGPNIVEAPKADLSAEVMITAVVDGKGTMPSFIDNTSNQEIADIIAYVRGDLKAGK